MARGFRIWQKKRGNRRTGSGKLGGLGEAAFYAAFLLLGCAGLVLIFIKVVIPQWRVNHVFVENECVVLDKVVLDKDAGKSKPGDAVRYRPEIRIQHEVEGKRYVASAYDVRNEYTADEQSAREVLDRFQTGGRYPCWHDPADPSAVVLARGYSWWFWLAFVVPVSFILTGGGGLIYTLFTWGKSAERRAAGSRQAAALDGLDRDKRPDRQFPFIPANGHFTESPGTTLAFRLPAATSPAWSLAAWLVAAAAWNGLTAPFVVMAINGLVAGNPDWLMTIFLVPFLAVGLGLIVVFLRQLLVTTGVGPTLVEISDLPVYPGRSYELFLVQTGRLSMKSFEAILVCEEESTYRHGTNTRTLSHRVYQQPLCRHEGFEVRHGVPFETRCRLEVPAGAMHSFRSGHNEVSWKIVVKGDVAGWPDYERSFPLIVYPCVNGAGRP